jgi:hypothetical protein
VLIELLETYGQGGNCGFDSDFRYDNSFLISDPHECYVMETSAKKYAVVKVEGGRSISNRLSIGEEDLVCGNAPGVDFAKKFTEPVFTFFSESKARKAQTTGCLNPQMGAAGLMAALRSHAPEVEGREFARRSTGSVCMHAGGLIGDQTTGSVVYALRDEKPITMWMTGCSTPCISAFKPMFWASGSPPLFDDATSSRAYWLQRERLGRAVVAGKVDVVALRTRIAELEGAWLTREAQLMAAEVVDADALVALSADASREEQALVDEFSVDDWDDVRGRGLFAGYWRKKNAVLGADERLV